MKFKLKSLLLGFLFFGMFGFSFSISYAGTFSQEINTSTGKLYPIKNSLNQISICNPSYAGTSCYEQSLNNGWYLGIVPAINHPTVIDTYTSDVSYSYQSIAGIFDSPVTHPSVIDVYTSDNIYSYQINAGVFGGGFVYPSVINAYTAEVPYLYQTNAGVYGIGINHPMVIDIYLTDTPYSYITNAGVFGNGINTSSGLAMYENTVKLNVFQGTQIYENLKLTFGSQILDSKSLSDSQKNSILYSSGGLFTASGSMEISMYNNSTIPSLNPTTYSIWKVKIGKYTIIAKELK